MTVGRLLSPVHSLGPDNRVCLWTAGCTKNCEGCISPELQSFLGKDINPSALAEILRQVGLKNNCSGLTISGGDPFEQAEDLLQLLKYLRPHFDDILVYTGFTLTELLEDSAGESGRLCLEYIDVLIDGRYLKKLNTPDCILRGSSNQQIHFLNKKKEGLYTEYMKKGRILESFVHNNQTIITGILNKEEDQ